MFPLDIRLFGKWSVEARGAPLPRLRAKIGQSLLALLVLRAGRAVERSWLAAALWPDSDEAQALYNLRRNLTDLRNALGPEAGRIKSPTPRSVRLNLDGCQCDVSLFDSASTLGKSAPSEALARAVAVYRGPLLEEFTDEWIAVERQVRAQAYLEMLETLAAREMTANAWAEAVRWTRLAVAADPFQEAAQHTLIEALAASGERTAAMLAYREFRRVLHEHLQTEPPLETQQLFRSLRMGQPVGAVSTTDRRSREEAEHPAPPLHIPRPVSALIGREAELEEVSALLSESRLVTLTGTGGVGKTRLALGVAERIGDRFPEGVWFVDLAPVVDAWAVPRAVAAALGVREERDRPLTDTLARFLAEKQLLLLLDNCEHQLDACSRLTAALLHDSPSLRVLATSRQALGLTGERAWRVPSLPLPEHAEVGADSRALLWWPGMRLFIERALEASSTFTLSDRSAAAALEICRRLDGIPLALELAAARVKVLSVEQIAARLKDAFQLLTGGDRTALPRQQTLRALIDWSYDLLTEPEQLLLIRLSVFAGGWTLEACEQVAAAPDSDLSTDFTDFADESE